MHFISKTFVIFTLLVSVFAHQYSYAHCIYDSECCPDGRPLCVATGVGFFIAMENVAIRMNHATIRKEVVSPQLFHAAANTVKPTRHL